MRRKELEMLVTFGIGEFLAVVLMVGEIHLKPHDVDAEFPGILDSSSPLEKGSTIYAYI